MVSFPLGMHVRVSVCNREHMQTYLLIFPFYSIRGSKIRTQVPCGWGIGYLWPPQAALIHLSLSEWAGTSGDRSLEWDVWSEGPASIQGLLGAEFLELSCLAFSLASPLHSFVTSGKPLMIVAPSPEGYCMHGNGSILCKESALTSTRCAWWVLQ